MPGLIRTKVAEATATAYADGADLMAGLLAQPMARRAEVTPEPEPEAPSLLADLLSKPRSERVYEEPEPVPVVVAEPLPQAVPVAPPVPMPKPGRVLRTRVVATVVEEAVRQVAHGEFDTLLAESVRLMGERRIGRCMVCGVRRGWCNIGPFYETAY